MSDNDGKINWFEIPAANTDRARSFYGGLFGWTFQPFDDTGNYFMTESGGMFPSEKTGITVYFGTSDIAGSIAKIKELGGSSEDPQEIPNVGHYATCTDTEGNAFGLFQPGQP
jgi:uncharacterized protein